MLWVVDSGGERSTTLALYKYDAAPETYLLIVIRAESYEGARGRLLVWGCRGYAQGGVTFSCSDERG